MAGRLYHRANPVNLTNKSRHGGRVPDNVSTIVAALRHGIGENQSP